MFVRVATKVLRSSSSISEPHIRRFYDSTTRDNTIYAPITSVDRNRGSPLCVIRVSGKQTTSILEKLTSTKCRRLTQDKLCIKPRNATLARVIDPQTGETIDNGLVLWFPGPRSYTGEDSCEFHLHGSQAVVSRVLDILAEFKNVRPAEPGEFTRRAVKNGKMSILQAEGLKDLIASQTNLQRRLALSGMEGSIQEQYYSWIENLVKVLAHLEASIDFGEDEVLGEVEVVQNCIKSLGMLTKELEDFIRSTSISREMIQAGAKLVILGKPNSGKSTLMNVLCQKDKSIVSDLSGTTRDVVEHTFQLAGHAITLFDTAGLKDIPYMSTLQGIDFEDSLIMMHEEIEREGIRRAYKAASGADVVIYLVDAHELLNETSIENLITDMKRLFIDTRKTDKVSSWRLVINKTDLNTKEQNVLIKERLAQSWKALFPQELEPCFISCRSKSNLGALLDALASDLNRLAFSHQSHLGSMRLLELNYVNERHLSLLNSAVRHLKQARQLNLHTIDEMAQHVRETVDYLSRIVGTISNEEVLDVIFRDFCIGK